MMYLSWPWVLILLPLPFLLPYVLPVFSRVEEKALKVPFFDFLTRVQSAKYEGSHSRVAQGVTFMIWALLVFAAAGPIELGPPIPLSEEARSIVLAVDLSGSMRVEDMREKRQLYSRLDIVKKLAAQFIAKREGDRIGLILFGSEAYLRAPLTLDRQTVADMLSESQAGIAGEQTAMGDALALSLKRLKKVKGSDKVIILLTDGRNNAGHLSPLQAAQIAAQMKVKIYTIGLGRDDVDWVGPFGMRGSILENGPDEETLKSIADMTHGQYFKASDPRSLRAVYEELDRLEPIQIKGRVLQTEQPLYPFFLAPALVLSVILVFLLLGRLNEY